MILIETRTNLAAAYASLGVDVTLKKVEDTSKSTQQHHFLLGGTATFHGKTQPTYEIRVGLEQNNLPEGHPMRIMLRADANRNVFLECLKRGGSLRIVPGGKDGWILETTSQAMPGEAGHSGGGVVRTPNIRSALSLLTAGHAPLAIHGTGENLMFSLNMAGPIGAPIGADLLRRWKDAPETFAFGDIFYTSRVYYENLHGLLQHLPRPGAQAIIRKPGTSRQVLLEAGSSDKAWDKARKFLLGR